MPSARPDAAAQPSGDGGAPTAADWRSRVLYLVMIDRFANGDAGNDTAAGADCVSRDDPRRYHGGDLAGVGQRVGYLRELGVSAVWITPVAAQVGCGYHGYWADLRVPDDGAIDPRVGTAGDYEQMAATLRDAGIELVLDMVVNHAGRNAQITAQRPGWFHVQDGCGGLGDPEIFCPLSGLPDFAHEDPEVADYLVAQGEAWARKLPFGGVRMDTAKHVPREFFAQRWLPAMRAARPGLFVVAEVFDESTPARLAPYLAAGFDSAFHFPMRRTLIDSFARGGSTRAIADRMAQTIEAVGMDGATWLTLFADNHDVVRWLDETDLALGADERLRRYHLALTALFTLPGIPQLYQGDELASSGGFPDNRRDMPAWAWEADTRRGAHAESVGDPAVTFELVRRLIGLRAEHTALWRGYYAELWRPTESGPDVFAFFRGDGASRVVVAFNNGTTEATIEAIPFRDNPGIRTADRQALPDGARLFDRLGRGAPPSTTIAGGRLRISLPAKSAAIYTP